MTDPAGPAGIELPGADTAPSWLHPLIEAVTHRPFPPPLSGLVAAKDDGRSSAVLILLSDGADGSGPDVLLTERAAGLRAHGGQPAFPGGHAEPGEDPVATALREATEETGLDPASVLPLLQVTELHLGFSGNRVVPVIGYWRTPGPIAVVDPAETSAVARIPIATLIDPHRRGSVTLSSGARGPAFEVDSMVVWGFTGILLDAVLEFGGWSRPWTPGRDLTLPPHDAAASALESLRNADR
ncbi:NUDIX hydrolase [Nakamurella lactea]|uniref:NUDIX hydrolase n=1 Tax=Nakamurella lactea TaxID=459515 RepID=UPI000427EB4C|nr:CoA pyrophosphatase [Nakamurella lactea]